MQTLKSAVILELQCGGVRFRRKIDKKDGLVAVVSRVKLIL